MIGLTFQEFDMDRRQAQVFHQSIKNSEHLETSDGQEAWAPTREQGNSTSVELIISLFTLSIMEAAMCSEIYVVNSNLIFLGF